MTITGLHFVKWITILNCDLTWCANIYWTEKEKHTFIYLFILCVYNMYYIFLKEEDWDHYVIYKLFVLMFCENFKIPL